MEKIISYVEGVCEGVDVEIHSSDGVDGTILMLSFKSDHVARKFIKGNLRGFYENGVVLFQEEMQQGMSAKNIINYYVEHGVLPDVKMRYPVRIMNMINYVIPDIPRVVHVGTSPKVTASLHELWELEKFGYLVVAKDVVYGMFLNELSPKNVGNAATLIARAMKDGFRRKVGRNWIKQGLVEDRTFYIGPS